MKLKAIVYGSALIMPALTFSGNTINKADSDKADYIFMEAQRQSALGNTDAYVDLLKMAHKLNPDDHTIGFYVGYYDLTSAGNDSIRFSTGYNLMQNHFNAQPDDYYNSFMYGTINDRLQNASESIRVWETLDSIFPTKLEPSFKLADALSSTRDSAALKRAVGIYNRIEKAKGKSIPLSSRKMRSFMATNDTTAVIAEVKDLLYSSPHNTEYNIFAGDIYAMFSQGDSALAYYNKACELDSTSGLAFYQRAMYYKNIDDSVAYDREVFNALTRESLGLDAKMELMTDYIRTLYDDSIQQPRIQSLFNTMLEQNPHEVALRDLYCSYLLAIQDYDNATEQLSYAVDIDPSDEKRWVTLSSLAAETGDYNKSIDIAERGIHYFPSSTSLLMIVGSDYQMLKQYDKALVKLNKALDVAPEQNLELRSSVIGSIGDLYVAKELRDSAYTFYDEALLLNPHNNLVKNNYAYSLAVENKNLDKAERMCADVIKERPGDANSLDTYAWVMFMKKNYVEAKAYIEKAIATDETESAELFHHAGDIYFWNSEPDKALEYWEKAQKLEPDNKLLQKKIKNKTFFFE
ncbi:MAG: hypothetical protein NC343_04550 [Muribaculum sp.]|nr:hypothetical protein [Muribaculaceae bacterium]MCM1081001.1 hypothetical protein [Muribaculum sp.]